MSLARKSVTNQASWLRRSPSAPLATLRAPQPPHALPRSGELQVIRTVMTLGDKLQFAVFFLILTAGTLFSSLAMVRPAMIARLWPGTSPRLMRAIGAVFLVAGLMFWGFSLAQLAAGTFKWKGSTTTYGFSDLVR